MNLSVVTPPSRMSIAMIPSLVRAGSMVTLPSPAPKYREVTGVMPTGAQPFLRWWSRSSTPDSSSQTKQCMGSTPYFTFHAARRRAFRCAASFDSFLWDHPCRSSARERLASEAQMLRCVHRRSCSSSRNSVGLARRHPIRKRVSSSVMMYGACP
jgi:hypothetical protein